MELKEIKEELLQAVELIADFEHSHLSIERDTALVKLRRAYEALRFYNDHTDHESLEPAAMEDCAPEVEVEFIMPDPMETLEEEPTEVDQVVIPEIEVEPIPEVEEAPEVEPEVETVVEPTLDTEAEEDTAPETEAEVETVAEVELESEPTTEAAPEPELTIEPEIVEPEPVSEPAPEPTPEPTPARPTAEPSLFGDDDIWGRPTPSRRKIISLYGDDEAAPKPRRKRASAPAEVVSVTETTPAPDQTTAPTITPNIAPSEPPQILADTIEAPKSIADTIVATPSVAESSAVASLVSSISVGDRFMLLRELFNSNEDLYEKTISTLDAMDNLDDCIIYIAENFSWRSSSDGAKLIMDLLQRKLG